MEDLCDLYHNPSKQGNSMAWPAQRTHFWDTFPPAPMSNVTPESTKKLYCFWSDHTSFSTILYDFAHKPTPKQTAHRVATFVASRTSKKKDGFAAFRVFITSDPKDFPKRETAWPGRPNGPIFKTHFPQHGLARTPTFHPPPVSNVASECIKKNL